VNAAVLPHATVAAGFVLALWLYVRLGSWRPKSVERVLAHAGIALLVLALLQATVDVTSAGRSPRATAALLGFYLPAVTHAFLSGLYLLVHLQRALTTR
jgi:hypothetical protein